MLFTIFDAIITKQKKKAFKFIHSSGSKHRTIYTVLLFGEIYTEAQLHDYENGAIYTDIQWYRLLESIYIQKYRGLAGIESHVKTQNHRSIE